MRRRSLDRLMWVVMTAAFVGAVLNVMELRSCFAVWCLTNAAWAAYNIVIGANAQAALFAGYFGLAVWGWISWGR